MPGTQAALLFAGPPCRPTTPPSLPAGCLIACLQLKSIKKELGLEKDEKTALVQKCGALPMPLQPCSPCLLRAAAVVLLWVCDAPSCWMRPSGPSHCQANACMLSPPPHPTPPRPHDHTPPRFRERLEPLKEHLPEAAAKVIEEELEKLQARTHGLRAGVCVQLGWRLGPPASRQGSLVCAWVKVWASCAAPTHPPPKPCRPRCLFLPRTIEPASSEFNSSPPAQPTAPNSQPPHTSPTLTPACRRPSSPPPPSSTSPATTWTG